MGIAEALRHKIDFKTKPLGSLGVLEKIAFQIGLIQQTLSPKLIKPAALIFAADHGIATDGVSAFPQEVTFQMVMNYVAGGAGANVFARQHGIDVLIIDAGVNHDFPSDAPIIDQKIAKSTKSFLHGPAMTIEQCNKAIELGAQSVEKVAKNGTNVIMFGEMGIGNTSSSAMLMHCYTGRDMDDCVGRGTGVNDEGLARKKAILKKALDNYKPTKDPIEILAYFGGFELVQICGAFLKAAELGMVILCDGFNATAALLAAHAINPNVLDYCIFSHQSDEGGHKYMIQHLGGDPILHLRMRLGEATGAEVAYPLVQSALVFLNEMASFADAGVSEKIQ